MSRLGPLLPHRYAIRGRFLFGHCLRLPPLGKGSVVALRCAPRSGLAVTAMPLPLLRRVRRVGQRGGVSTCRWGSRGLVGSGTDLLGSFYFLDSAAILFGSAPFRAPFGS